MAFVPAPNIMMVELRATNAGQKIENRFMFNQMGPVTPSGLQDIATLAWNWWQNSYAEFLPSTVALVESVATDLTTLNGPQFTYAPASGVIGGNLTSPLPNEVSLAVSLRSTARGRSARGRFYVLAIPSGEMADANSVESLYASGLVSAAQTLINDSQDVAPLTIVSYRTNNAPRPGGPVYFPVSSAVVVDLVVDSMKRRKPGVGQ
jgi:hypothetical protein